MRTLLLLLSLLIVSTAAHANRPNYTCESLSTELLPYLVDTQYYYLYSNEDKTVVIAIDKQEPNKSKLKYRNIPRGIICTPAH